jgi:hypothetical protein
MWKSVLTFYNAKKPVTVSVDNSHSGAAVFLQNLKSVAYASKVLRAYA